MQLMAKIDYRRDVASPLKPSWSGAGSTIRFGVTFLETAVTIVRVLSEQLKKATRRYMVRRAGTKEAGKETDWRI